jgi:hypothetical protein
VDVVLFVGANQALPEASESKPPVTADEMMRRGFDGFYTIVGDHTQEVVSQLHAMFNTDPKWSSLIATVHVCQRTPEVFSALKSRGILGNIKGQRHGLTFSAQEKIEALHEDHLRLAEHASVAGHKERVAALKEQRRQDFGGISPGQMTQLWSTAPREGKVWELVQKIISGDVVQPDLLA